MVEKMDEVTQLRSTETVEQKGHEEHYKVSLERHRVNKYNNQFTSTFINPRNSLIH